MSAGQNTRIKPSRSTMSSRWRWSTPIRRSLYASAVLEQRCLRQGLVDAILGRRVSSGSPILFMQGSLYQIGRFLRKSADGNKDGKEEDRQECEALHCANLGRAI